MSADSASRDRHAASYKALAVAFSYPDEAFLAVYPQCASGLGELQAAYDRTFRIGDIWLYGTEHSTNNEFQKVEMLADIMGFHNAFGVEPRGERADALCCELEFMYYLIAKRERLGGLASRADAEEKAAVCGDAERKFFTEHLAPAAQSIAAAILNADPHPFYAEAVEVLNAFVNREQEQLEGSSV